MQIVDSRKSGHYFPSFKAAEMVGLSGRALSKITSSFMVITSDKQKINLGLSLKFEAKALKVIDYSKKEGRFWEFSQKAVDLIQEYKVSESCGRELGVGTDVSFHPCRPGFRRFSKVLISLAMVRWSKVPHQFGAELHARQLWHKRRTCFLVVTPMHV